MKNIKSSIANKKRAWKDKKRSILKIYREFKISSAFGSIYVSDKLFALTSSRYSNEHTITSLERILDDLRWHDAVLIYFDAW